MRVMFSTQSRKSEAAMAPLAKTDRNKILKGAVKIVRTRGAGALTAKSLADELGCSTQPLFWHFSGMGEIRAAVYAEALARFDKYIHKEVEGVTGYRAIGVNYIRFARAERQFYKLLFMSEKTDKDFLYTHVERDYVLRVLEECEGIKGEQAEDIFRNMWLFVHGISAMIATGTAEFEEQEIREMLKQMLTGQLLFAGKNR